MDIEKFTDALNSELIEQFKTAVEIGKWPGGRKLTPQQIEMCMQAIIAYEYKHVDEEQRTGYVPPAAKACVPSDDIQPIQWK